MGAFLEQRNRRATESREKQPATRDGPQGQWRGVQFVPARWLALALSLAWALFSPGPTSKVGVATLVWSFTPRRLRIVAAGFTIGAMIMFMGAIAAITLLALQLT